MTVRNVRAYAGRGLIPAPRLQGRTGYYGAEHVSRLRLIRELVDRGYTLAAVEKAFASQSESTAVHALDLLAVLDAPLGQETAEVMLRDSLAMLTGSRPGTGTDVVDDLVRLGLAEVSTTTASTCSTPRSCAQAPRRLHWGCPHRRSRR